MPLVTTMKRRSYRDCRRDIERVCHYLPPLMAKGPCMSDGRLVFYSLSRRLAADRDARDAVEIVFVVFPRPVDQKVFFFVDEVLPLPFAHLEIGRELDGVRRAGLLAEPAEDAPREIDAEKCRIAPARLLLRLPGGLCSPRGRPRRRGSRRRTARPRSGRGKGRSCPRQRGGQARLDLRVLHRRRACGRREGKRARAS